uniref:Small ribosomal subunit protein uS8c n=1 Tax=Haematococcus lacustris TaxID=44745 RepID=A0A0S2IDX6_HAELA|nr:30S ribosomal protein S8 [Haematococcus lacustris]ALO21591.1 ribosomal protein S8 [Haematococcus lacustris]AUW36541.1 30S ribosomal protein S8 [Haematococcus lacustris]
MITSVTKGFIHDSISDLLTRIRNACLAKKANVLVPYTNVNFEIVQLLEKEGFIQGFQKAFDSNDIFIRLKYRSKLVYGGKTKISCITNLQRISKPGLRIYANYKEIPRILGGTGIVVVSTPNGILTDIEARLKGIGGELLCSIW